MYVGIYIGIRRVSVENLKSRDLPPPENVET